MVCEFYCLVNAINQKSQVNVYFIHGVQLRSRLGTHSNLHEHAGLSHLAVCNFSDVMPARFLLITSGMLGNVSPVRLRVAGMTAFCNHHIQFQGPYKNI